MDRLEGCSSKETFVTYRKDRPDFYVQRDYLNERIRSENHTLVKYQGLWESSPPSQQKP